MITSDIINVTNFVYLAPNKIKLPVFEKIKSFSKLQNNWHYGEGIKFKEEILTAALDFVTYLNNNLFDKFDAFPGFDGEILITCYSDKNVMDITINSDFTGCFIIESLDGETLFESDTLSISELKKGILLQRLLFFREWNLSEFYQLNTMTASLKDLKVLRSKTLRRKKEVASQLLKTNAQSNIPTVFANTSKENILFTPSRQYFGNSTLTFCQTTLD